ncbi:MAG TPA: hypothetical protein VFW94_23670 [Candidatus Acidoferrales bacterium]|nr:hypothetical protein [Candidatus Acidoferrales bacterium]
MAKDVQIKTTVEALVAAIEVSIYERKTSTLPILNDDFKHLLMPMRI